MSDKWRELQNRSIALVKSGNPAYEKIVTTYYRANQYRETQPELKLDLLTEARNDAQRLNEPWWVLFYDAQRLSTLTADLHDFARAMPLAMELMAHCNFSDQPHPEQISVLTDVLYAYSQVDPLGYSTEIDRGFAYLDEQISNDPVGERFVLNFRRFEHLCEIEQWAAARDLAKDSLTLADRSRSSSTKTWHGAWALFKLCEICHAQGSLDEVADYATEMADRPDSSSLGRTRASASLWLAVTQRSAGDTQAASRSFYQGMGQIEHLDSRDEICATQIAAYHESGGDFKAALDVYDRALAVIAKKGMLHRACLVQIERCRLLAQLGELSQSDVDAAKTAAAQLRTPNWYLAKLRKLGIN